MQGALALPDPREFRQWIERVMKVLEISAYRWSVQARVPPNLISKFLSGEQHDLRLAAASGLVREAERLARLNGVDLPPFGPAPPNSPNETRQDGDDNSKTRAATFHHSG